MKAFRKIFFSLIGLVILTSCQNKKEAAREQALADYRTFVTEFEQDSLTETELRAMELAAQDSTAWATEKEQLQEKYNTKREVIETSLADLEKDQQNEVAALDQRYQNALQLREQKYQDVSHRYQLRRKLLGLQVNADDMSNIDAENIGAVYERFITGLSDNTASFQSRDWNLVEGWWNALNSRYRTLESELTNAQKQSIQNHQKTYQEIREEIDKENGL